MKIKNSRERQIWIDGLFNGALIMILIILSSKFFIKAMNFPNEISIWVNLISGFFGLIMILFVILIFIKFWRIVKDEFKSR